MFHFKAFGIINLHYEVRICEKTYSRVTTHNKSSVWYKTACIRRYCILSPQKTHRAGQKSLQHFYWYFAPNDETKKKFEINWPLYIPGKNHDVQAAAPPINTNWCPYDWEASDEVKMILEHNTLLTISSSCYWKSIIRLMGDGDTIVHRFLGICFSVYW